MTFDPNEGNRSPHQTFGLAPNKIPDFGDPELLPKGTVTRGSKERNLFGGRERGGASAGVLHPDGPGPYPDDIFNASDIEGLPWVRRRGNEWTTATFRAAVLAFLGTFIRARPADRIIGWQVVENANGARMGTRRLAPDEQHLVVRLVLRRVVAKAPVERQIEVGIAFSPADREAPALTARLGILSTNLDVQLAGV